MAQRVAVGLETEGPAAAEADGVACPLAPWVGRMEAVAGVVEARARVRAAPLERAEATRLPVAEREDGLAGWVAATVVARAAAAAASATTRVGTEARPAAEAVAGGAACCRAATLEESRAAAEAEGLAEAGEAWEARMVDATAVAETAMAVARRSRSHRR